MKTKIFSFQEWLELFLQGEAYEDMLTNGNKRLLAIECRKPKCRAKVSKLLDLDEILEKKLQLKDGEEATRCQVCNDVWKRPLGKIRGQ